jgi:chromosome segregation ATPase
MELEQIIKRLDWLDEEHRKDKELIDVLSQHINIVEGELKLSIKKIKDLNNQISKISTTPARIDQYDTALNNQRNDLIKYFDDQDKNHQGNLAEIDKRYQLQFAALNKSLTQLNKFKDSIAELKRALKTHTDEETRRAKLIAEWEGRMQAMVETVEEVQRSQKIAEEPRRQESKRLSDLQAELVAARKRLEESRQKSDLFSDSIRRIETRLNEILASEGERRQAQTAFIETQSRLQVERDHAWKEWLASLEILNKQSGIMDRYFQDWETAQRAVKHAQESYEEITQKFERRINEITEMQRLSEDRFRQEWVSFKSDDQKQWTTFVLAQDENNNDSHGELEKLVERLTALEDLGQTQQDVFQQTSDANLQMFQGLLAQIHELLSAYERIMGSK